MLNLSVKTLYSYLRNREPELDSHYYTNYDKPKPVFKLNYEEIDKKV